MTNRPDRDLPHSVVSRRLKKLHLGRHRSSLERTGRFDREPGARRTGTVVESYANSTCEVEILKWQILSGGLSRRCGLHQEERVPSGIVERRAGGFLRFLADLPATCRHGQNPPKLYTRRMSQSIYEFRVCAHLSRSRSSPQRLPWLAAASTDHCNVCLTSICDAGVVLRRRRARGRGNRI